MLITTKIKLMLEQEHHEKLLETMKRYNAACTFISQFAFEQSEYNRIKLQKLVYYDVRDKFQLSSQMAILAVRKVADAYTADKAKKKKEYKKPKGKKNVEKTISFRETGAMSYDARTLSFTGLELASILTLDGRIKVPMGISPYHQGVMQGKNIRGQAELVWHDCIFYLLLVVERPANEPYEPIDAIGVDLGIKNIAADSMGESHSGDAVNAVRHRNAKLRAKLQAKGTKSAKRLLARRRHKEARFSRDVNHCISKHMVEKAKRHRSLLALEDLTGIRERITVRKAQRRNQHAWAFAQLRSYIEYKAWIAGVPVVLVDPRNTSRECPQCGHIAKENRKTRDWFRCQACEYAAPADNVAALNIRSRALVSVPNVGVAI
ncbi:RNA-guided endonuclease InsQ/TnpB family protein [Paenibacillus herberti]|uniref:Transposase n=1 Tax=Paenibacillus herberti TaxID=1619309 RepID=A0A229NX46_9BACL|nr:RNA-guided endonuclease TnpB family protein [Paenibacillus herberti]OXM14397.1 transposase [Paenibacillus herberti]